MRIKFAGETKLAPFTGEERVIVGGTLTGPERGTTSMALLLALSTTLVYAIVIFPLASAVAVNSLTIAFIRPLAAVRTSKLVSTWVPLIETLNLRSPATQK